MTESIPGCPLTQQQVLEQYFLEHRAKLLDVAAFLDRYDRAARKGEGAVDFRVAAFVKAAAILTDGQPNRTKRIQEALSDPTSEPIESAAGMKGAYGAYPGT